MTLDVHKHLTHARWYVSKLLTYPSGNEPINSKKGWVERGLDEPSCHSQSNRSIMLAKANLYEQLPADSILLPQPPC